MDKLLLALHIAAGNLALLAAAGAVIAPKGGRAHTWVGRAFTVAMTTIFLTAVPLTLIRPNLFLLLVALFNFYLVASGWLRARNRKGLPTRAEWGLSIAMMLTAAGMAVRGAMMLAGGNSMGTVLVTFAGIGGLLAWRDLEGLRAQRFRGTERIASHLTRMLGGTIGAITAFAVTNVRIEPAFVVWLAPSLVFTPLIVYWNLRVRRRAATTAPAQAYAETPARS
jgi:hypothetical protein